MASVAATFMKKFFQRIIKDFQYKQLLPLKLLFFVHASTIFVLYPYLTIHMRELGINVEETAIMSAVTPVIAIIMPPLAGMVADKIGNFKILLSIFSALGGGAALLLLLVPVGRITITYPDRSILDVGCGGVGSDILGSSQHPLSFSILENEPCDHQDTPLREIETRLESCGFACEPLHRADFHEYERILTARSYDVAVTTNAENKTDTYYYKLTLDDMPAKKNDMRDYRNMENNIHYRTSIRNLTNSLFFFPTTGLYNMDCAENATRKGYQCDFGMKGDVREGLSQVSLGKKMYTVNLMQLKDANGSSSKRAEFASSRIRQWFDAAERKKPSSTSQTQNATCNNVFNELGQTILVRVPVHNPANKLKPEKTLLLGLCQPRCLLTVPRSHLCSNLKAEIVYDPKLTFWVYLIIRVFIGVIGGTAFAMFEGAVIAILREHNADYGLQRIYATIGGMISSPLSGLLIDYASQGKGYTDFRPAFYLYAFLKIASAFLMLTINLEFKAPATNVVKDVLAVLKNAEIVALFVAIFVLGTAWGYLESFLFWLLQDLGASRSLMGITITVGGIAGIPLLVLSGPIINRIGHANVLFIGFIFYAIRLTGYSLIYNPWLCLIFEAMESVTSSLSFTAAVTYAAKLSTTTTDTSIQGLLGGLYYGVDLLFAPWTQDPDLQTRVIDIHTRIFYCFSQYETRSESVLLEGKGAGSLVGGYLMKGFGTRQTYRIFAVMCLIVGFIYFFFNKFFLRKRPMRQGNDIVKKKPKNTATNVVEIDVGSLNAMPMQEKPNGVPKSNDFKSEILSINKAELNRTYGNLGGEVKENGMLSDEMSKGEESQDRGKEEVNLGFVCDNEEDEKMSGNSGPKLQGAEAQEKSKVASVQQ